MAGAAWQHSCAWPSRQRRINHIRRAAGAGAEGPSSDVGHSAILSQKLDGLRWDGDGGAAGGAREQLVQAGQQRSAAAPPAMPECRWGRLPRP